MSEGDGGPADESGPTKADGPADADGPTEPSDEPEAAASDAKPDETSADAEARDSGASGAESRDAEAGDADDAYAVPTETESDAETAWRRELAEAGELTPNAVEELIRLHGGRGARAVEAVSEGRVKRYRDFTVVVGHEDEYVVEDGGCTCKDSSYNLDPADPHERCWHVLAVAVAERIGEVDHHEMWYSEVRDFL